MNFWICEVCLIIRVLDLNNPPSSPFFIYHPCMVLIFVNKSEYDLIRNLKAAELKNVSRITVTHFQFMFIITSGADLYN